MTIVGRIKEFIGSQPISTAAFEKKIGISKGYLGVLEKRGGLPGIDILLTIVDHYPQLDLMWLLTGKGEMIKSEKKDAPSNLRIDDMIAQRVLEKIKPYLSDINEKLDTVMESVGNYEIDSDEIKELINETKHEVIKNR